MSFCASRSRAAAARVLPFAVVAAVAAATATTLAFEPSAHAQGTTTPAPKKDDPKKGDAKPAAGAPAPAAPPTTQADGAKAATTKPAEPELTEADGTRAIYLSADIGFTRADVGGFSDNTGFDKTSANGVLAGIGVGYRYKDFRIGGRFRDAATTEFSLWSLMGEIGYGLKFRPVSPTFFLRAGYMFDVGVERAVIGSSLPKGNIQTPDVDLNGLVLGAEVGASYWITKILRVGPFIGLDLTFLHRSMVKAPQSLFPLPDETRANPLYSGNGSGVGYMVNFGLRGTGDISF
jgi:hypothetical protein